MALKYKIDILEALKDIGCNTTRIREEKLLSESVLQSLRDNKPISWSNLGKLCTLLKCEPGELIECCDPDSPDAVKTDTQNALYRVRLDIVASFIKIKYGDNANIYDVFKRYKISRGAIHSIYEGLAVGDLVIHKLQEILDYKLEISEFAIRLG